MPTPTRSDSYPPAMFAALDHARAHGSFLIPTQTPAALRLQFYGLKFALKREEKASETGINGISFILKPEGLLLRSIENAPFALEIEAALKAEGAKSNPINDAEAALDRILNF